MTRARRSGGVAAQPGNAFCAAATAASTSAGVAKATRPDTSPVAGLNTSPDLAPLAPFSFLPPMKWAICAGMTYSCYPCQPALRMPSR